MMLCAHCLQEVRVPVWAAWPSVCPRCLAYPFALVSFEQKDGMEGQGPGRKGSARTTQGRSAGRGSRASIVSTNTGVRLG